MNLICPMHNVPLVKRKDSSSTYECPVEGCYHLVHLFNPFKPLKFE